VVLQRNEMRLKVKALKDFLKSHGYSEDDIREYLDKKSDQQRSLMHRAIVGLFFRNSDFEIIPKALNQWKRWVQQRRLVKQWSRYTLNALNHPLHWFFRRWKLQDEDAKHQLKQVLKKDLIKKIIGDELAIGSAQHRLQRMDETIENLGI
jgi:DNA-binding transcriptional MerR regulator